MALKATEKLYDIDTLQTTFTATVLECRQVKDAYWTVLDRTAFFPEGGGQYADTGTLCPLSGTAGGLLPNEETGPVSACALPVLDVQLNNNIIYHKTASPLAQGSTVTGEADWLARFDNMQQHSGEHIISGLVHRYFGYDNVGFHLGKEEVTLDFNGIPSREDWLRIEKEANEAVFSNLPVKISFPSREELPAMTYRSKIELSGQVRIVEIPGYDVCACCAPHVRLTGEIGLIKIIGVMKHRGGVRVNILCGMRALTDYRKKLDSISSLSALLSARQDAVADAAVRLKNENAAQHNRLCALQAQLLQAKIEALPHELTHVCLFGPDLDSTAMRRAVNVLTERYSGYCGIFTGNDTDGYRYIVGSSSLDCREASALLRERFAAKGGGSFPMVQGSVSAAEEAVRTLWESWG